MSRKTTRRCCGAPPSLSRSDYSCEEARDKATGYGQRDSRSRTDRAMGNVSPGLQTLRALPGRTSLWRRSLPNPVAHTVPLRATEIINHSPHSLRTGPGRLGWRSRPFSHPLPGCTWIPRGGQAESRPLSATVLGSSSMLPALKDTGQPPAVAVMLERR